MKNNIFDIYTNEINCIIKDSKVTEVFLVGSSRFKDLKKLDENVNDIDIFVFREYGEEQERIIKNIGNIDFDINYFSVCGREKFIKNKEYFFLKEMENPKIVYDKNNNARKLIEMCKNLYFEGPNKLSTDEKNNIKLQLISKIEELKDKEKYSQIEASFLGNVYLKELIVSYFRVNDKWVPKDKKLLKTLQREDESLFNLIEKLNGDYQYKDLLKVYEYIFKINS